MGKFVDGLHLSFSLVLIMFCLRLSFVAKSFAQLNLHLFIWCMLRACFVKKTFSQDTKNPSECFASQCFINLVPFRWKNHNLYLHNTKKEPNKSIRIKQMQREYINSENKILDNLCEERELQKFLLFSLGVRLSSEEKRFSQFGSLLRESFFYYFWASL